MRTYVTIGILCALLPPAPAFAGRAPSTPAHVPDAIVDLATSEGVALVRGQWRYADARIVEVDHRLPGPDLKASGAPVRTHDVEPKAGRADFDDRGFLTVAPEALDQRRSTGRLAFGWYRIAITVPSRVGDLDARGSTVVFEIVADDYAEVWVDGRLPQVLGQSGGPLAAGWNAPNRLVVARDAVPGQVIQLAVFVANGPLSDPPANFVWLRSATLDFYRPERWSGAVEVPLAIERRDAALDAIVPPGAKLERLAEGFGFTEGPVWHPEGYLLFSDPNENVIHRWTPDGDLSVYRTKSGYKGADIGRYRQPGSNGLALDRDGRLTICEHGNRRVTRLEKNGVLTVLADRFEGKRLNSPNDLAYRSDGALFFTDPWFGLPQGERDAARELPYTGVFVWKAGALKLLADEFRGPNGIAFSPDERHLYVGNWDEQAKIVKRFDVAADGSLSNGTVFFDAKDAAGDEAIDGIEVDGAGNLFVSGPTGTWVLDPTGKVLGVLQGPELAANFALGGADRRTLFLAARTGLYRLQLGP